MLIKNHRETVQSAPVTDFEQIVQMIYDDEDIGKSYNKNDLAEQLLQRSKEGYSRNYVIKNERYSNRSCMYKCRNKWNSDCRRTNS